MPSKMMCGKHLEKGLQMFSFAFIKTFRVFHTFNISS